MLTNTIMSEKLSISITKVRRNTKEFLGEDPKAIRRSGYKREFSNNDGFFVYLGGLLVSEFGYSFAFARDLLKLFKPWLLKNGLVPDIPKYASRNGADREVRILQWSPPYEIVILQTIDSKYWECYARGIVKREIDFETDSMDRNIMRETMESFQYELGRPKVKKGGESTKKVLDIGFYLWTFIGEIFGEHKYEEWIDEWENTLSDAKIKRKA